MLRAVALCSLLVASCATGAGPRDGGRRGDAGRLDAAIAHDAGPALDGGHALDAGQPIDDGGQPIADAGRPSFDAGRPIDAGSSIDAGRATDGGRDAGPLPTPGRGSYLYRRIPVGGLTESMAVAFHPDGTYAIVLERTNAIRVYDWATMTVTRIDRAPGAGRTLTWGAIAFDPAGTAAWIVGSERMGTTDEGVIHRFDDAAWRGGDTTAMMRKLADTRPGERFTGIAFPIGPGHSATGWPVVLSQSGPMPGYIARLRELDTTMERFAGLVTAQPTSAGCDDLAFVNNEFGTWGIAVVCGTNGADAPYYTEITGVGEWRAGPPATLGNTSRIASHPSGRYALAASFSGSIIPRFQDGAWRPASSSPRFATETPWGVAFAPDGRRALIVGRASGSPLMAGVLEYRHDLWTTGEITDVSIPAFDMAPYLGDSNTYILDAAFRPGCDGGLVVGGRTDFTGSTGMIIEFSIEGGTACR